MTGISNKWYVIVNPHAGSGKTLNEWKIAEERLCELSIDYQVVMTSYKKHALELAGQAAAEGYRSILVVGGDGSVHEVLSGIMSYCETSGTDSSEFRLGVIPIGSGNDWIKTLGVPHDTEAVVGLLSEGSYVRQDVPRVVTSKGVTYMANIGGIGFDSRVCERVNRQKESGKRNSLIYVNALLHMIFHLTSFQATVKCDGKVFFEGDVFSIALGNGRYSGSGMLQVPDARIDDGLLDITVIPRKKLLRVLPLIPRLFTGTFTDSRHVLSAKCRHLEISSPVSELIEIDGEIEGTLPLTIDMDGHTVNALSV